MGDIKIKRSEQSWVRWFHLDVWSSVVPVVSRDVDKYMRKVCSELPQWFIEDMTFEIVDEETYLIIEAKELFNDQIPKTA